MSDIGLDIRPVTKEDLPDLITLYRSLSSKDEPVSQTLAPDRLSAITNIPNCFVFGGWANETLVTSCTQFVLPNLSREGRPYALIENVVTDQAHRNKGFGKQILKAAAGFAFEQGCYKVMLMTGMKDRATLGFYESAGFEQSKTGFQMRNIPVRSASNPYKSN